MILERFALLPAVLVFLAACSGRGSHGTTATTSSTDGEGGTGTGGEPTDAGTGGAHDAGTGGAPHDAGTGAAPHDAGTGGADAADGATFDCEVDGLAGHCIDTSACAAMPDHASTAGHCPGAANIECCTPYGLALCDPKSMPRPQPNAGNTVEAPGVSGCPAGMIPVATFCIDQYEATLVDASTGAPWCPFDNPGTLMMKAVSVAGTVPQGYIDGIQAGEACLNAGKRLCTDAEWLRACEGPKGNTYPYGDTRLPGVCNDHRDVHPAIEYFGTSASWIWSEIGNACIDQLPQTVDPTGTRLGCVTAEGAFDMMGNLHEWTADPAGTFRGGYYVDTVLNGPGCLYATTAHDTSHWDYSTGFRCCAD